MDKVYIVSSGDYSDYHIERVFKSITKAKKYSKAQNHFCNIEVFDIDDDNLDILLTEGKFIRGDMKFDKEPAIWMAYECKLPNQYILNNQIEEYCKIDCHAGIYELYMGVFIPKNQWQEDKSREKFKKMLVDKVAEIKSMIVDGMTIETINEALKEKQ